jgi:hypothetical protein
MTRDEALAILDLDTNSSTETIALRADRMERELATALKSNTVEAQKIQIQSLLTQVQAARHYLMGTEAAVPDQACAQAAGVDGQFVSAMETGGEERATIDKLGEPSRAGSDLNKQEALALQSSSEKSPGENDIPSTASAARVGTRCEACHSSYSCFDGSCTNCGARSGDGDSPSENSELPMPSAFWASLIGPGSFVLATIVFLAAGAGALSIVLAVPATGLVIALTCRGERKNKSSPSAWDNNRREDAVVGCFLFAFLFPVCAFVAWKLILAEVRTEPPVAERVAVMVAAAVIAIAVVVLISVCSRYVQNLNRS